MKAVFREFSRCHVALSYDDFDGKRIEREFMKRDNGLVFEVFFEKSGGDRYEYVRDGFSNLGSPVTAYGALIDTIRAEYKAMKLAQRKTQSQLDNMSAGPGVRHLGSSVCGI